MTGPLASLHIRREQFHLAWDRSIEPIATVASGDAVDFDALDASCGQITASSTVADIATLDFSRVDQVNGPIAVEGAEAGDRRSGRHPPTPSPAPSGSRCWSGIGTAHGRS